MIVDVWLALSDTAIDAFKARRAVEEAGDEYTGPVTDRAYRILSKMANMENRQRLFKGATLAGKTVQIFSLAFTENLGAVNTALTELEEDYPGHIGIVGAWWWDGRQVGTEWELDGNGDRTGNVTGTPAKPIPNWAYQLMPDLVTYDGNGDEVSRTPASSNADLKDVNLLLGQAPRRFS